MCSPVSQIRIQVSLSELNSRLFRELARKCSTDIEKNIRFCQNLTKVLWRLFIKLFLVKGKTYERKNKYKLSTFLELLVIRCLFYSTEKDYREFT